MSKAQGVCILTCLADTGKTNYPLYGTDKFCNYIQIYCSHQVRDRRAKNENYTPKTILTDIRQIMKQRVTIINDFLAILEFNHGI